MDPETQREYEDQIKQTIDLLSRQNSIMSETMKSMQNQLAISKKTATDTNTVNDVTKKQSEITRTQTKVTEASVAATEKYSAAMNNFGAALGSSASAITGFGKSLLSSEKGLSKYGNAVNSAGDAAWNIGKNFGLLGVAIGGLVKGLSMVAGDALKLNDALINFRDETTKQIGIIPKTSEELSNLSTQAKFSRDDMMKLQKITAGLGKDLLSLGGYAGTGAVKFMQMADVGDDVRASFGRMGVSQEQLLEMQSKYVQMQSISGKAYENQSKSMAQLKKESLDYATNLTRMSSLTGETADKLETEREALKSEAEEQSQIRAENIKIAALRIAGKKEEADSIKLEQNNRTAMINKMSDLYGKETASQIGRVMRTGSYDEFSSGLATLGIDFQNLSKEVKTSRDIEALSNKTGNQMTKAFDQKISNLNTAIQYGGEETLKAFGINNEALTRSNRFYGKTIEERDAMIKADMAKKSTAGTDGIADANEKARKLERDAQALYQQGLLKLVKVSANTANAVDALKVAAWSAATALGVMAASTLFGGGGGGIGGKFIKGFGKKAVGTLEKIGIKGATKAGIKGLAAGAKIIPGVGLAVAGGMAAADAYEGYQHAGENLGIKGRQATTGEKWSSAAGSALSGLSFGLIGADTISKSIAHATGVSTETNEATKKNIEISKKLANTNVNAITTTDNLKKAEENRAKVSEETTKKSINSLTSLKLAIDALIGPFNTIAGNATTEIAETGIKTVSNLGSMIGSALVNTGADMKKYLATIGLIESGGKANAKAGTSSAGGLFQFTKGTWNTQVKAMGANFSEQDRFDPTKATQVASFMANQQQSRLEKKLGRKLTSTDLYMSHFLGEGGASKFLSAMYKNPNSAADAIVGSSAAIANKSIFYDSSGRARSLQEVYGLMNKKVGNAATAIETGKWGGKALPSTIAAISGSTVPMSADTVATKITKAPTPVQSVSTRQATAPIITTVSSGTEQMSSINIETMSMLSQKLDTMISILESSNDTQNKLLNNVLT